MKNDLFIILGQVTYSYSRIDFFLAKIAEDLKIVETYTDFIAGINFQNKILEIKKATIKSGLLQKDKEYLISLMDELDTLRKDRNNLIHSLILNNGDGYLFYRYQNIKGYTNAFFTEYNLEDLKSLNERFIDFHNKIVSFRENVSIKFSSK